MRIGMFKVILLLLLFSSFFGCKNDNQTQAIEVNDQSNNDQGTYFDFNSVAKDSVFVNKLLDQASLLDEFKATSITRYNLKLEPLNGDNFSKETREHFKQTLDLSSTYGIQLENGPLRLFKASYVRVEKDRIVFTNNLKWLMFPVKKNLKDRVAKLYKVNYTIKDTGVVTISTIGDSRLYNREAQELRKSLDLMFDGQLQFLGDSQDTNQYSFLDYGVYSKAHFIKAVKKAAKSDYYVLFIGLNDYQASIDSAKERIAQAIAVLKGKNPECQILLTTLPMVSRDAQDSKARNSFYKAFNKHVRSYSIGSDGQNITVIDLAQALEGDSDYLSSNGVHLLQRGYTVYADLLSKTLVKDSLLGSRYTGILENFNSTPLSDQVLFTENSNATAAGNFMLKYVKGQKALVTQLHPTLNIKAPHRAEMTVQLEPYFSNNQVWIGVDFMVPNTYVVDTTNLGSGSMIMQVHSKPNEGETWSSYQKNLPFNRPCLAFFLEKQKTSYELVMYYGLNGKPDTPYKDLKWSIVGRKEITPDAWNRLDFTIKMSHEDDGFVKAWLNNETLSKNAQGSSEIYGANMHNEALPYLKFGQYRYWADSHMHEVFFDNLKAKRTAEDYFFPSEVPSHYKNNPLIRTQ